MNSALDFCTHIFGLELTSFGVIAATLFVFLQFAYARLPSEHVGLVFKSWLLLLSVAIGLIVLLVSGAAELVLSYPAIHYTPFHLSRAIRLPVFPGFLLGGFISSLILFALFAIS